MIRIGNHRWAHAHSSSAQTVWKDGRIEEWKNGRIEEWKFVYNGSMEWPFSASVYNPFSHEIGFCDRSAFSSNSPARMRHSVQIDTPLSSRSRALWRSFFLPFYRPTHSLCACLSACSDIYDMSHSIRTLLLFLLFLFRVLKG